jgi:hypothetical protein
VWEIQRLAETDAAYKEADSVLTALKEDLITKVQADINNVEQELGKSGLSSDRRQYLEGKLASKQKELNRNKAQPAYNQAVTEWNSRKEQWTLAGQRLEECRKANRP